MSSPGDSIAVKKDHVLESRVIAALIDILVLIGLGIIITGITGGIDVADQSSSTSSFSLSGVSFWVFVLVVILYYFLQESSSGQTLGKRLMKVRVAAIDGDLSKGKVLTRTLLRIVDVLPVFYVIGFVLVLVTPGHQRIGDLVAGTLVRRG